MRLTKLFSVYSFNNYFTVLLAITELRKNPITFDFSMSFLWILFYHYSFLQKAGGRVIRYNENMNKAVAESPPILNNILFLYSMKLINSYYSPIRNRACGNCVKLVYIHEKSNYNTRFRKTKPHCLT
jgi:hypothetical protein